MYGTSAAMSTDYRQKITLKLFLCLLCTLCPLETNRNSVLALKLTYHVVQCDFGYGYKTWQCKFFFFSQNYYSRRSKATESGDRWTMAVSTDYNHDSHVQVSNGPEVSRTASD